MTLKNTFRLIAGATLLLSALSYAENPVEAAVEESCDATAKILVKCMISTNCSETVSELRGSLSKATALSEIEKDRFVSYCRVECQKGNAFRKQGILQEAVAGEYTAIYTRCLKVLSLDGDNQ